VTALSVPSSYRLDVGQLDAAPVSVVRAPHLSVLQWLVGAAAPSSHRVALVPTIGARATRESRQFLSAIGLPGLDRLPDALVPIEPGSMSVGAYARRLRATDPDVFSDEVDRLWNGRPPTPWRLAADHPRAWLDEAASAVLAAWPAFSRQWKAAEFLLRREEARVGTAVVTGTLDALIEGLSPRLHVVGTNIELEGHCSRSFELAGRRLVFVPTLARRRQLLVSFETPDVAYIAYTLPGSITAPAAARPDDDRDRLTSMLGPIRAEALRTLDTPHTMGALARTLHVAPSTLTYHCDQLVVAGLLHRQRRGQAIWVSRTDRGVRLLNALE
jgi:DNA-binding transcriptional ArsR family regulator